MKNRLEKTLLVLSPRWMTLILACGALLVSGSVGGLAALLSRHFAGLEWLMLGAMIGGWVLLTLARVGFDALVFLCFALLSLVRIEPAPVDGLSMLLLLLGLLYGKLSPKALADSGALHLTLGTFIALNFVALAAAQELGYSVRYLVISLYLIGLAYFIKMYATSFRTMRVLLLGYLASALLSIGLIASDYLGLVPPETFVVQDRAMGFFKDANVHGPFLILMVVFLVDEIVRPQMLPRFTLFKIVAALLLIGGVFLSFSRAAWANLIIALGIYLVLNFRLWLQPRRLLTLIAFVVLGTLSLVVLVTQLGLLEFLFWRATPMQSYDTDRFAIQMAGINAGADHPFGVGPGMWFDAHSLYVRTFAEYGILGFVSFFTCMGILFFQTLRSAIQETEKPYGLSAKVMVSCLAGLLFNGFVIDTIHWRHFWVIVGLAWVVAVAQRRHKPVEKLSRKQEPLTRRA